MHSEHIRDEELIELALDACSDPAVAAVAGCTSCSDRLADWQGFLDTARSHFSPARVPETPALRTLAQSVFAETTREGAGRRPDFRLLIGRRPSRLRKLSWPSLAAAIALVVLIGSSLFHPFVDPGVQPVSTDTQIARAALVAPIASGQAETVVGRILGSRSAWLNERTPLEPREFAAAASVPAARALLCEHVLDRFAVEEYIPEGFDRGIQSLLSASTQNRAERRLELAALVRARDYGLLNAPEQRNLGEELAKAGVDPLADPLFAEGARTRAPIDSAWLSALAASLGGAERCDPVVQAWLAKR